MDFPCLSACGVIFAGRIKHVPKIQQKNTRERKHATTWERGDQKHQLGMNVQNELLCYKTVFFPFSVIAIVQQFKENSGEATRL